MNFITRAAGVLLVLVSVTLVSQNIFRFDGIYINRDARTLCDDQAAGKSFHLEVDKYHWLWVQCP